MENCSTIETYLATILGIIVFMSEAMPFLKKCDGNGLLHYLITSECLKGKKVTLEMPSVKMDEV